MAKRNNLFLVFGIVFLFGILVINFIGAGISDKGVEYDNELIGQFTLNKWVFVTVDIKDTTNITIPYRTSPDFESTIQQRTEILSKISDEIILTLSEEEFRLDGKLTSGRGFYGNITKEGFDKLLNDERIRKIYADKDFKLNSGTIVKNLFTYLIPLLIIIVVIILVIKFRNKKWKIK